MKKKIVNGMLVSVLLVDNVGETIINAEEVVNKSKTGSVSKTSTQQTPEAKNAKAVINIPDQNLKACLNTSYFGQAADSDISQAQMESLTSINCEGKDITNLEGLEYATNLTELKVEYNNISDITVLGQLSNLESIYLSHNPITEVSALNSLVNLDKLYIDYANVSDLSSFAGLRVNTLSLIGNKITDVSPLNSVSNLQFLFIGRNHIEDLSPLQGLGLTQLLALNQTINLDDIQGDSHDNIYYNVTNIDGSVIQVDLGAPVEGVNNLAGSFNRTTGSAQYSGTVKQKVTLDTLAHIEDENLKVCINQTLGQDPNAQITKDQMSALTSLNCDNKGITSLSGLETAVNLVDFSAKENQISDTSPLNNLQKLDQLMLDKNLIVDTTQLANIPNLTYLTLNHNNISDVSPLKKNPNLRILYLDFTKMSDLSSLTGMNLTTLSLRGNDISDLNPLSSMTSLETLYLGINNIVDVSPLNTLTKLKTLYLANNHISDLSPIGNLTVKPLVTGQTIDLDDLNVDNYDNVYYDVTDKDGTKIRVDLGKPAEGVNNLTGTFEQNTSVSNYAGTVNQKVTSETSVDIEDDALRACMNESLGQDAASSINRTQIESLTDLNCDNKGIVSLNGIQEAVNLVDFSAKENQISDTSPLNNLQKLDQLMLDKNLIVDTTELANIPNLTYLSLNHNNISDVSPLKKNTKLRILYLDFTKMSDLSSLTGMNLTTLSLRGNEISDLNPLSSMTSLETLYLGINNIVDVSPLNTLTKLKTLYLANNHISDLSPIGNLSVKPLVTTQTINLADLNVDNYDNVYYDVTDKDGTKIRVDLGKPIEGENNLSGTWNSNLPISQYSGTITQKITAHAMAELIADTSASTPEEKPLTNAQVIDLFNASATDKYQGDITSDIQVDQSTVDYSVPGTYKITFSVTNNRGATSTQEVNLEITDLKPTITSTKDSIVVLKNSPKPNYLSAFGISATEINKDDLTSAVAIDDSAVDLSSSGTYPVKFSVRDEEGNLFEKTLDVIVDASGINADVSKSTTEETPLSDEQLISLFNAEAFDDVNGNITDQLVVDQSAVDYNTPGTYKVIFKITDSLGKEIKKEVNLEITDLKPTITTQKDTLHIKFGTTISDYVSSYGLNATEINSGDLTSLVNIDDSDVDYGTPGTYEIIFRVSDEEGNTVSKKVTLEIDGAPRLEANDTVNVNEEVVLSDADLLSLFNVTVNDDFDSDLSSAITVDDSKVNYSKPGTYQVKFSVEDSLGNKTEISRDIIVTDVLPTITTEINQITLVQGETISNYSQAFKASASEITDGDLTSAIYVNDTLVDYNTPGTYNLTFYVSDEEGNIASKTVKVVVDSKPVITANASASINEENALTDAQLISLFNVSASDLYQGDISSAIKVDQSAVNYSKPGTYNVKFTVSNNRGTTITVNRPLQVLDLKPQITLSTNEVTVIKNSSPLDYVSVFGAVASEIKPGDLNSSLIIDDSQVNYGQSGTYQVKFSVTDEEGNYVETFATVTVDSAVINAALEAQTNEEVPLTDSQLLKLFKVSAVDDLDGLITDKVTVDQSAVDYSKPGIYPVTFMVVDSRGIEIKKEVQLTVNDIKPGLTTTTDTIRIPLGTSGLNYIKLYGAVATEITKGDISSTISVDVSKVNFKQAGTYPITFKARDEEGNIASKTVSLEIDGAPTISAVNNIVVNEEVVLTDQELMSLFKVNASDDFDDNIASSITIDQSNVDYSKPGSYPISFTVKDSSGNQTTIKRMLTVKDSLPTISTEVESIVVKPGTKPNNYVKLFGASATEIKAGDLSTKILIDDSKVNYNKPGTYDLTFKVKDEEGNLATKIVKVVVDGGPEIIGDQETDIKLGEELSKQQLIDLFEVQAEDGIDGDLTSKIVVDDSKVNYAKPGSYEVTFMVTNSLGDTKKITRTLVIKPNVPIINVSVPELTVGMNDQKIDFIEAYGVTASELGLGDLSGQIKVDTSQVDFSTPGTYPITFTVTDEYGQTISQTVNLVIEANLTPEPPSVNPVNPDGNAGEGGSNIDQDDANEKTKADETSINKQQEENTIIEEKANADKQDDKQAASKIVNTGNQVMLSGLIVSLVATMSLLYVRKTKFDH